MALLLMEFTRGVIGEYYQEVINGEVTRWFDKDGNLFYIPNNNGEGVSYGLKDDNPPTPPWYVDPTQGQ